MRCSGVVPLTFHILMALVGAGLDPQVAPDQPAPLFFTDEPLIVSLSGAEAINCAASIYVRLPDETSVNEPLDLPGSGRPAPTWIAADLPNLRGAYRVYVTNECPDGVTQVEQRLMRVDRPPVDGATRFGIAVESWSQAIGYGARCLPAKAVRFRLTEPDLARKIRDAKRIADCDVHIRVTPEEVSAGADVGQVARELGEQIDVWEFAGVAGPHDFGTLAEPLRAAVPRARLAVAVTRPQETPAYLSADSPLIPDALVIPGVAAQPFARAIERAGYERFPLVIDFDAADDGQPVGTATWEALLDAAARGADTVFIPQSWLEDAAGFTPLFAECAWIGRSFHDATWLGDVAVEGGHEAWLLRAAPGMESGDWLLGVRLAGEQSFAIDPGEAARFRILDAYGNPVVVDPGHERRIVLPPGGIWFVPGEGGAIMEEQLVARIRAAAENILEDEALAERLPPEAAGALTVLKEYTYPGPVRFEFFALLRSLPLLEDQWHRGALEMRIAVPLIRHLAQVAADLAVLEEDLGEAFLEPLDKTLANCSEWLERYPEPVEPSPVRERRVAFLHDEVRRLMSESRAWQAAGRTTEAKALAALAEWRARCLAPAATAKRVPDDEAQPQAEPNGEAGSEIEPDAQEDA